MQYRRKSCARKQKIRPCSKKMRELDGRGTRRTGAYKGTRSIRTAPQSSLEDLKRERTDRSPGLRRSTSPFPMHCISGYCTEVVLICRERIHDRASYSGGAAPVFHRLPTMARSLNCLKLGDSVVRVDHNRERSHGARVDRPRTISPCGKRWQSTVLKLIRHHLMGPPSEREY